MFIFENHKADGHFYNYINTKFELNHKKVYDDVPFVSNGEQYFFAWYEVEIPDKAINLFPFLFGAGLSAALGNDDDDLAGPEEIRNENYYIAIEVYNDMEPDCLEPAALSREFVLKYLRSLKKEYLSTHNYNEVVFKN